MPLRRWIPTLVILIWFIGYTPPGHAFGTWRVYVGAGPGWFRYEPLDGLRQDPMNTFELQSGVEFTPFGGWFRDFMWLGFAAELSTHETLLYSTNHHQAFNLYGRVSVPVPLIKIAYLTGGVKWVQIRTLDARRDLSTPGTGWVPYVGGGLQIRLFRIHLRAEYQFADGRLRIRGERFTFRKSSVRMMIGLDL